ncbi:hypothetical protein HanIR_Chr11g0551051 [Helianthus annuus]|nr:hypothetical protein HanIR_Chr11g0551051 [Helianthus annuus]
MTIISFRSFIAMVYQANVCYSKRNLITYQYFILLTFKFLPSINYIRLIKGIEHPKLANELNVTCLTCFIKHVLTYRNPLKLTHKMVNSTPHDITKRLQVTYKRFYPKTL